VGLFLKAKLQAPYVKQTCLLLKKN
jgi:hypothetical protein